MHWISAGIDTSARGGVVLKDVDLTIRPAGPNEDILTTAQLRLVGADEQEILSATETLVLDRFAEVLDVALANATASYFGGSSTGHTNVAGFAIDGLEPGAKVHCQSVAPGADSASWLDTMPLLADGLHTIKVRQLDAAGNASAASNKLKFTFDNIKPTEILSFQRIEGESLWNTVNAYNSNGSFTLEGIDLALGDQIVELQVIDAAGNAGFEQSWDTDGPAGLSVEKTIAGLKVTSSSAGDVVMGNVIGFGGVPLMDEINVIGTYADPIP